MSPLQRLQKQAFNISRKALPAIDPKRWQITAQNIGQLYKKLGLQGVSFRLEDNTPVTYVQDFGLEQCRIQAELNLLSTFFHRGKKSSRVTASKSPRIGILVDVYAVGDDLGKGYNGYTVWIGNRKDRKMTEQHKAGLHDALENVKGSLVLGQLNWLSCQSLVTKSVNDQEVSMAVNRPNLALGPNGKPDIAPTSTKEENVTVAKQAPVSVARDSLSFVTDHPNLKINFSSTATENAQPPPNLEEALENPVKSGASKLSHEEEPLMRSQSEVRVTSNGHISPSSLNVRYVKRAERPKAENTLIIRKRFARSEISPDKRAEDAVQDTESPTSALVISPNANSQDRPLIRFHHSIDQAEYKTSSYFIRHRGKGKPRSSCCGQTKDSMAW